MIIIFNYTPVPCPMNDERGCTRGYDFHNFVKISYRYPRGILAVVKLNFPVLVEALTGIVCSIR